MPKVSVSEEVIASIMTVLQNARGGLEEAVVDLRRAYFQAGVDWNDKKYSQLGDIVERASRSILVIGSHLGNAKEKVKKLQQAIIEYINTGAAQSSSNANAYSRCDIIDSRKNSYVFKALKGVEHRPIVLASEERTEQQIISSISGGDMTEGSCSSLALAYAGNRAGYVVYDFRDGQSREAFSTRRSIEQIANMDGVNSEIRRGTDDTLCAEQLMACMETGREYYMATGAHAAIVRLNDEGHYQYLELQSGIPSDNGWQPLTLNALFARFGCEDGQTTESSNYLIELDSLQSNTEFLNLLGYINTDESAQVRGESGYVR